MDTIPDYIPDFNENINPIKYFDADKEVVSYTWGKETSSKFGIRENYLEKAFYEKEGTKLEFDGIWESSLTDSTSKGKPDTELVDFTSRFQSIEEILEVTTKPIIVDGDTGGKIEHFKFKFFEFLE